jgi:hypothetical protein
MEKEMVIVVKKVEFIRIMRLPEGEAPIEVRKKWVGLVLPCLGVNTSENRGFGVVTGKPDGDSAYSRFVVPQKEALDILNQSCPEAADWFKNMGYPKEGMAFGFKVDEAEVVG